MSLFSFMRANKRRHPELSISHDEDHGQQEGADEKKKARPLPVPWMTDKMASTEVLPRVLTEYTTEDAERFDEEMARTEKRLHVLNYRIACYDPATCRMPMLQFVTQGLVDEYEEEDDDVDEEEEKLEEVGDLLVSKAEIKRFRSFVARRIRGFHPISERLLCDRRFITEAAADECRRNDRFLSKAHAWMLEGATEVLRHYDAARQAEAQSPAVLGTTTTASSINPPASTADH